MEIEGGGGVDSWMYEIPCMHINVGVSRRFA